MPFQRLFLYIIQFLKDTHKPDIKRFDIQNIIEQYINFVFFIENFQHSNLLRCDLKGSEKYKLIANWALVKICFIIKSIYMSANNYYF